MSIDTTVAIMAYNERESLHETVMEICDQLSQSLPSWEVLIIDDGSIDGSHEVAGQLASLIPQVRVVRHPVNLGLGGVYRTGFAEARGEWLTFYPADGQIPASSLTAFLSQREGQDLVLGYLPQRPVGVLALSLSWVERLIYRSLFGHFPKFQGVMMVRCSVLRQLTLVSQGRGWAILMEMIIKTCRAGHASVSVPTSIRERRAGQSKVRNLRTIWVNLLDLLWLRWQL